MAHANAPRPRLAELIAALSLATDLGMGQPLEHALRTCLLALRLGERLGLSEGELSAVYYVALLRRIGCTSDSYELGQVFGDDLAAHARVFLLDFGRPLDVLLDMLRHAGAGRPPWQRARTAAAALAAGPELPRTVFRASCEVAQALAGQMGFEGTIQRALGHTFERWDGRGYPHHIQGEAIALPARIVQVAEDAEVFHRLGGVAGAGLEAGPAWEAVLAAEPGPRRTLAADQLDAALQAMACFADLKSPYTAGHSPGVAGLAGAAAAELGLPAAEVVSVRRAALVHDLGRVAVPNRIWDKPGPLTDGEWERVRLHPYYSERVLARSQALAHLGALAGLHHERLDGSGYYRAALAGQLGPGARVLAAADVYHAMTEPRPHRPARPPDAAAAALRRQVRDGRLDGAAVDAVLRAAGHRVRRRRAWPAGLSAREVEVLRLVARGLSNRQIARALVISEPTAAHHIRHIYTKIGVTTRAGATLFAMQHALLEPGGAAETWSEQTMPAPSPGG